jgi:hypothetical protein
MEDLGLTGRTILNEFLKYRFENVDWIEPMIEEIGGILITRQLSS